MWCARLSDSQRDALRALVRAQGEVGPVGVAVGAERTGGRPAVDGVEQGSFHLPVALLREERAHRRDRP